MIKSFKENICQYSTQEGVRAYALQQVKKATFACSHLADPDKPDSLHDFRVAVRRLRTWLREFKRYHNISKKTLKCLGGITDTTNKSRDLEVFRNWMDVYKSEITKMPTENKNVLKIFRDHLTTEYELEIARINNHVPNDWKKLNARLIKQLNNDIEPDKVDHRLPIVAAKKIQKICKSIDGQLALIHDIDDRIEIHKLRIYFKRLRYLLEPFRFQFSELNGLIKFLKNIQDTLGDFRDAHISIELLTTYHSTLAGTFDDKSVDNNSQHILFEALFERARSLELERYDRFRELFVKGEFRQIICQIRSYAEKLRMFTSS